MESYCPWQFASVVSGSLREFFVKVDRKFIMQISSVTGFQPDIIEKAYRLTLLLKEINNHHFLNKEIVLKGGTAINFLYLSLPRLSVDLDFNFIGSIKKDEKDLKRKDLARYLSDIFLFLGYQVQERSEYGLHQFFLNYKNSASNKDVIKVEINYLMRVPVTPFKQKKLKLPIFKDVVTKVRILSLEENYAGKIKALLVRGAGRDLFDVYCLLNNGIKYKVSLLRKIVIFFGCLDRKDFRKFSSDSIDKITEKQIKSDLLPLLRKSLRPSRDKMIKKVKPILDDILSFRKQEEEYIKYFFAGKFIPELLFAKKKIVDLESLRNHPMVLWKQHHIKEWLKSQSRK